MIVTPFHSNTLVGIQSFSQITIWVLLHRKQKTRQNASCLGSQKSPILSFSEVLDPTRGFFLWSRIFLRRPYPAIPNVRMGVQGPFSNHLLGSKRSFRSSRLVWLEDFGRLLGCPRTTLPVKMVFLNGMAGSGKTFALMCHATYKMKNQTGNVDASRNEQIVFQHGMIYCAPSS